MFLWRTASAFTTMGGVATYCRRQAAGWGSVSRAIVQFSFCPLNQQYNSFVLFVNVYATRTLCNNNFQKYQILQCKLWNNYCSLPSDEVYSFWICKSRTSLQARAKETFRICPSIYYSNETFINFLQSTFHSLRCYDCIPRQPIIKLRIKNSLRFCQEASSSKCPYRPIEYRCNSRFQSNRIN